ncbi:MAG: glycosyltransferase [Microbacterium sp.]
MSGAQGRALPGNRWDLLEGELPPEPPLISVIVAHYRQPEQLARTLRALSRQDHPASRTEVIVADDGSPEPPTIPPGVRLVRQDDAGFRLAGVRNLGAAAAVGDVLVFLDADTTPEPGFLRELSRLPALAPDCVTVGLRRHADLSGVPIHAEIERAAPEHELPAPDWLSRAYRDSRDLLEVDARSYRFVIGAVLACSSRLFDEVGGFDESFTSYGGEDWEWAYRAWVRGALLAHVPTAVAWHDGPDAAGRPTDDASKNDEAIRLSDLIPVPGSRGIGRRSGKVDVAVIGPSGTHTAGQAFVCVDGVLAALPGAEFVTDFSEHPWAGRLDRVRLRLEILHPFVVDAGELRDQITRVEMEDLGELLLVDAAGTGLLRIVATRAAARNRRWGRGDLFADATVTSRRIRAMSGEVDVESYLGGWS